MRTTKEERGYLADICMNPGNVYPNQFLVLKVLSDLDTLERQNAEMRKALEQIKDGGVPIGVQANVEQRMLAMCDLASKCLASVDAGEE